MSQKGENGKKSRILGMVTVLVWLVVFLISILGIFLPVVFFFSMKRIYEKEQQVTLNVTETYISAYIATRARGMAAAAASGVFADKALLAQVVPNLRGIPKKAGKEQRAYLQRMLDEDGSFRFFAFLTPDTVQPVLLQPYAEQEKLTLNQYERGYSYREWAQKTIALYRDWDGFGDIPVYVSDAFVSQPGNFPAISLSVPILGEKREMVGILYANMLLDNLSAQVKQFSYGKTGVVYLTDSKGHLLAHPNEVPWETVKADDGSQGVTLKNFERVPMVAQALRGVYTSAIYRMPESEKMVLSTYEKIEGLGWLIVLQQDVNEAFSAIQVYMYFVILIVLGAVCVSFLSFRFIAREMAQTKKEHQELMVISETDPLTGLLNRRSMLSRMSQIEADYQQNGQKCIICMFDIDNFKCQ